MSGEIKRIKKIIDIDYSIEKSNPANLVVTVTGQVPESGWSKPTLSRREYIVPPADGIWEYDFYGIEPKTGGAVISEIKATNRWEAYDEFAVKGVRVYGEKGGIKEVVFG